MQVSFNVLPTVRFAAVATRGSVLYVEFKLLISLFKQSFLSWMLLGSLISDISFHIQKKVSLHKTPKRMMREAKLLGMRSLDKVEKLA